MLRISKYAEITDFETRDKYILQTKYPYIVGRVVSVKPGTDYQQKLEIERENGKVMGKASGFAVYICFVGSMNEGRVRVNDAKEVIDDMAEYYLNEVISKNVRAYRKSAEEDHWIFKLDDKHKEEREVSRMAVAIRASEQYVEGDDSDLAEIRRESFLDGAFWYSMNGVHEAKKFREEE